MRPTLRRRKPVVRSCSAVETTDRSTTAVRAGRAEPSVGAGRPVGRSDVSLRRWVRLVDVEVSIRLRAVVFFDFGSFDYTARHAERYPTYVRTPNEPVAGPGRIRAWFGDGVRPRTHRPDPLGRCDEHRHVACGHGSPGCSFIVPTRHPSAGADAIDIAEYRLTGRLMSSILCSLLLVADRMIDSVGRPAGSSTSEVQARDADGTPERPRRYAQRRRSISLSSALLTGQGSIVVTVESVASPERTSG